MVVARNACAHHGASLARDVAASLSAGANVEPGAKPYNSTDAALAILGNLISLSPRGRAAAPPPPAAQHGSLRLLRGLLEHLGRATPAAASRAARSGNSPGDSGGGGSSRGASVYHPLLGWAAGGPGVALLRAETAVRRQLDGLWAAATLDAHFGRTLHAPLAQRPATRAVDELDAERLPALRDAAAAAAEVHLAALRALEPSRM